MDRAMMLAALLFLAACSGEPAATELASTSQSTQTPERPANPRKLEVYSYDVVQSFPHGTTDFTQGLFFADGVLYETTGRIGQSSLIRHSLFGNVPMTRRPMPGQVFGEGSTAIGDRIISLTWRDGVGFIHDIETLTVQGQFPLQGEGWGLTHDGDRLIVSDGTDQLRFLDPDTFEETGSIAVTANGKPVPRLNELEYIDGEVWANIWQTDVIVRIDPQSGIVSGFINLAGLYADNRDPRDNVLNGIAFDPTSRRLFVTGKNWPEIHEIEIKPAE